MAAGAWTDRAPAQDEAGGRRQKKPWATPRVIESELVKDTENSGVVGEDGGEAPTSGHAS